MRCVYGVHLPAGMALRVALEDEAMGSSAAEVAVASVRRRRAGPRARERKRDVIVATVAERIGKCCSAETDRRAHLGLNQISTEPKFPAQRSVDGRDDVHHKVISIYIDVASHLGLARCERLHCVAFTKHL